LTDPLITACMIVRNEAHNLPACFASAAGVVDEWIVLDTGSTDGTVNVARSLGATVLQDPWRDDFSYSRNLSLEPATGRWILILDGDDRLHDPAELRRFLASAPEEDAFQMLVRSSLPAREGGRVFDPWHIGPSAWAYGSRGDPPGPLPPPRRRAPSKSVDQGVALLVASTVRDQPHQRNDLSTSFISRSRWRPSVGLGSSSGIRCL
jgi:glycosyltransferase involved in cell wall biosynthesis